MQYSLKFEINVRILFVKVYIKVRFIFVLMSHIIMFIYCYGLYLDLIGYIEFKILIRFYPNFLRFYQDLNFDMFSFIHTYFITAYFIIT